MITISNATFYFAVYNIPVFSYTALGSYLFTNKYIMSSLSDNYFFCVHTLPILHTSLLWLLFWHMHSVVLAKLHVTHIQYFYYHHKTTWNILKNPFCRITWNKSRIFLCVSNLRKVIILCVLNHYAYVSNIENMIVRFRLFQNILNFTYKWRISVNVQWSVVWKWETGEFIISHIGK